MRKSLQYKKVIFLQENEQRYPDSNCLWSALPTTLLDSVNAVVALGMDLQFWQIHREAKLLPVKQTSTLKTYIYTVYSIAYELHWACNAVKQIL